MLNLNDITFNKRLGNLIGRNFEMPYVSYCHPLWLSGRRNDAYCFFEKCTKFIQLEFFDLLIVIDGKPTVYRLKKKYVFKGYVDTLKHNSAKFGISKFAD